MKPIIEIRAQTAEEEFYLVWSLFHDLPDLREHHIHLLLPQDIRFLNVAVMAPSFRKGIKAELHDIFINEIYNRKGFDSGIEKLKSGLDLIESVIPVFNNLHEKWQFKLSEKYEILLTKYGSCGSYYVDTSQIVMLIHDDGKLCRDLNPIYTVIHEMIHIGTEKVIVEKFGLTFEEKEHVVYWICKKLMPDYYGVEFPNEKFAKILENCSLEELPEAVRKYKDMVV